MSEQPVGSETSSTVVGRGLPSRTMVRPNFGTVVFPVVFACCLFLAWQFIVRTFNIPAFILPAPTDFFAVLADRFEPLVGFAAITARSTLIGFSLGIAVGLLLGGLLGSSRLCFDMVYPSLIAFHAIPTVALIPLFLIWFGTGTHISVLTATLASFFPVTVIVSTAIASSSPELDDVLRSLGARKIDVLTKVAIPRAMPAFFGSVKLAITAAFIGSVVAEIYAGSPGIGRVMILASNDLNGPLAFAGLVLLAAMGVTLYMISAVIEKALTGWAYRGH
jgi:NitT/TauT family transport system permease protein